MKILSALALETPPCVTATSWARMLTSGRQPVELDQRQIDALVRVDELAPDDFGLALLELLHEVVDLADPPALVEGLEEDGDVRGAAGHVIVGQDEAVGFVDQRPAALP